MTLNNLRQAFANGTKIYFAHRFEKGGREYIERFEIDNLYWGIREFAEMDIIYVEATGKNEITVFSYMPIEVFRAWEKYGVDSYNNNKNN